MDKDEENELEQRLTNIHERIQWIADQEARAAWVKGYGASGEFMKEKENLLKQFEEILDKLFCKP